MASKLSMHLYDSSQASEWDMFIERDCINGSFLQSRRFLSYHPDGRFEDYSLVVRKGESIVAVIPACIQQEKGLKVFASHNGSTFGGIVISRHCLAVSKAIEIVRLLDDRLTEHGFDCAHLKQTSSFLSKEDSSSLEYALQHEGYSPYGEISFVIDFQQYQDPVEMNFSSNRRRDCRYGEKAGCSFRALENDKDIGTLYSVLEKSLAKFDSRPVHTLSDLLEFKNERLESEIRFYGVDFNERLVAGAVVFLLNQSVFHTQYLAADPEYLSVFPMNYLDWNLIDIAKREGFDKFSFGISTEEKGRVLNSTLAAFKEGFGGSHSMNWSFFKKLGQGKPSE